MAANTPIMNTSSSSIHAKYVFCRGPPSGMSCHAARMQIGTRIADMTIIVSAMPSTPSA